MASDIFAKYTCTYCQEEIKSLRVKCVECSTFELCLQCFSSGAEIGTHKRDHAYQFIDSVVCDVFRDRSGWSAREEMYLLNAIEHYSYGNWKDISQYIGTRTSEESRDEYNSRFLGGDIGRHTWVPGLRSKCKLNDLTLGYENDSETVPNSESTKNVGLDLRLEDFQQLNYMHLRDEFDVEYDNEAENIVSNLSLNVDDDELDIALKLTQVEIYTHRLRERKLRKKVVQDNQLISLFFNRKDKLKRKMSKEEKELEERLRPFHKVNAKEELILMGVSKQKKLIRKLVELMRYRRNGLIKLEEIAHFVQERQNCHSLNPGTPSSDINLFSFPAQKKKEQLKRETLLNFPSEILENADLTKDIKSDKLLSTNENQLCSALDLTPTQYISIKAVMLADPQLELEDKCSQNILDFLVSSGWVNSAVTTTET